MAFTIRNAQIADLEEILVVFEKAKAYMRAHGNHKQWADGYPNEAVFREDIRREKLFIVEDEEGIAAVFYAAVEADPSYQKIDGAWLNDEPYTVIHRIASNRNRSGVATYILNWVFEQTGNVRIDTHEDNLPMHELMKKLGFTRCGIIYLANGDPRIAYQKIRK